MSVVSNITSRVNDIVLKRLGLLNLLGGQLTLIDQFGGAGDTIMAATVCRILKQKYPRLRLNLQTKNPDLVRFDPAIDALNASSGAWTLPFHYLQLLHDRDGTAQCLNQTLM